MTDKILTAGEAQQLTGKKPVGGLSAVEPLVSGWISVNDQKPEPSCDINDLLLWCPDHQMSMTLVLGQYDGESFTAFFEIDDEMNDVSRRNLYVTHWMPAPHMGPHSDYGIWLHEGR